MDDISERRSFSPSVRILLLLFLSMAGLVVVLIATVVIMLGFNRPMLHLVTILQDILVFIVPAVVAVAVCYRRPMQFMCMTEAPRWQALAGVVAVAIVSIPAMNWLVDWNEHIRLPESLAALERMMQEAEAQAGEATEILLSGTRWYNLVVNVLVVGVMAGLSEEMFFRGAMMRLASPQWRRAELTVWIVAIVFSAIHLQFYGFVPRLLLGAWMGYLLVWSRSLWVPILAHALNNSIVVVATWMSNNGIIGENTLDKLGVASDGQMPWLAIASAVVTTIVIVFMVKIKLFSKKVSDNAE